MAFRSARPNINWPMHYEPATGKWYIVFSNEEATTNYQLVDAEIELTSDAVWAGIENSSDDFFIKAYPNPFSTSCYFDVPENTSKVEIYNLYGKLVEILHQEPFTWTPQEGVVDGIYLLKLHTENSILSSQIIYRR